MNLTCTSTRKMAGRLSIQHRPSMMLWRLMLFSSHIFLSNSRRVSSSKRFMHLSSNGVVVLNTAHTNHDYRLVQAFVNTMSQVFSNVYTFDVPGTFNTEIMATVQPTSISTFQNNLTQFAPGSVMAQVASEVSPVVSQGHPQHGGIVFTDDRAPIEQITDQLLLSYIQQH